MVAVDMKLCEGLLTGQRYCVILKFISRYWLFICFDLVIFSFRSKQNYHFIANWFLLFSQLFTQYKNDCYRNKSPINSIYSLIFFMCLSITEGQPSALKKIFYALSSNRGVQRCYIIFFVNRFCRGRAMHRDEWNGSTKVILRHHRKPA